MSKDYGTVREHDVCIRGKSGDYVPASFREGLMQKVQITEAQRIADRIGADAVVVLAFKGERFTGTSYGATKAKCKATGKFLDDVCGLIELGVIAPPDYER